MAVGGSGGHFSPDYFEYIKIPNFPQDVEEQVVKLYHNEVENIINKVENWEVFIRLDKERNIGLGIWELDKEKRNLQNEMLSIQEQVINGYI